MEVPEARLTLSPPSSLRLGGDGAEHVRQLVEVRGVVQQPGAEDDAEGRLALDPAEAEDVAYLEPHFTAATALVIVFSIRQRAPGRVRHAPRPVDAQDVVRVSVNGFLGVVSDARRKFQDARVLGPREVRHGRPPGLHVLDDQRAQLLEEDVLPPLWRYTTSSSW